MKRAGKDLKYHLVQSPHIANSTVESKWVHVICPQVRDSKGLLSTASLMSFCILFENNKKEFPGPHQPREGCSL